MQDPNIKTHPKSSKMPCTEFKILEYKLLSMNAKIIFYDITNMIHRKTLKWKYVLKNPHFTTT